MRLQPRTLVPASGVAWLFRNVPNVPARFKSSSRSLSFLAGPAEHNDCARLSITHPLCSSPSLQDSVAGRLNAQCGSAPAPDEIGLCNFHVMVHGFQRPLYAAIGCVAIDSYIIRGSKQWLFTRDS